MLIQIACLAATLAPQQEGHSNPSAPATAAAPESFAKALPGSTLLVAQVGELAPYRAELRETALAKIIEALPIPAEAVDKVFGRFFRLSSAAFLTCGLGRFRLLLLLIALLGGRSLIFILVGILRIGNVVDRLAVDN